MKIWDAYVLARTKRKTRRVRTSIVVLISSLLFAVLFFGVLVLAGFLQSLKQVQFVGFNGRYLTQVTSVIGSNFDPRDVNDQMDAELRNRHVAVTEQTHTLPSYQAEFMRRVNQILADRQAENDKKLADFIKQDPAVTATYHLNMLMAMNNAVAQPDPAADPYVQDVEKQVESGIQMSQPQQYDADQPQFLSVESGMLTTQIQPGQTIAWHDGDPLPLFIPYDYLEKLSGRNLRGLSAANKNAAYRDLIKHYTGTTLTYCYRNVTAQSLVRTVAQYNYDAVKDKLKSTNPLPIGTCQALDPALLKKAGLTAPSIDATEQKPLFPLPKAEPAVTKQITFKIVGFVPAADYNSYQDPVTAGLASINSWPASIPFIVPAEVAKQQTYLQTTGDAMGITPAFVYVDFNDRAAQKAFMKRGCDYTCQQPNTSKPFMQPFGNISVAVEGILTMVRRVFMWGVSIVTVIASLMLMLTIGKVIADSSKEIAVFRALGARRLDIAQVYYVYGSMLAVSAVLMALILGTVAAYGVGRLFSARIADGMVQATGAYNVPVHASLLGWQPLWLGGLTLVLILGAWAGIALPVITNANRKIINTIREE